MAEMDDDDLLDALGVEAAPTKAGTHTRLEERLIAGFEDILRFVEANGRAPQHGEDRDDPGVALQGRDALVAAAELAERGREVGVGRDRA